MNDFGYSGYDDGARGGGYMSGLTPRLGDASGARVTKAIVTTQTDPLTLRSTPVYPGGSAPFSNNLALIPKGAVIDVLEWDASGPNGGCTGGFAQVLYNGITGFSCKQYLTPIAGDVAVALPELVITPGSLPPSPNALPFPTGGGGSATPVSTGAPLSDNTKTYLLLGAGLVGVGGLAYLLSGKKRKKARA